MDTYSLLREIADSWVLLALFCVFLFVIAWAWRPGSRPIHDDAAQVPFREIQPDGPGCGNACDGCSCGQARDFIKAGGTNG
ncbi:cbb3-type cytochrome c oxidase subunit 3 [Jannaschia aquimarina]|uniref:Cbb3-type cytochrome oxidase component FixQ n=1 Tax=Jannaschia aquimarina TaxID=935700 RepID=A0A0D1EJX4_9RHOB|nr:cbb3-type cytochrome c oxidase subunit 3 [Jannaschia aquimarina]KIT16110.1 Cbb3-type cytochrome oxidase component FixQ [Jannaschia aquimarina]SNT02640.1 cytochrome c oxidase cbb3-type subunit 4 [Jannaschia aquimarina]